ncbi:MAG: hypothetical protein HY666_04105 [Chloroflexi bacterium]|nr:hypothetical protein [Chloroflexota bacterium]
MLTLPKPIQQQIAKEFLFVANKIEETPDLSTKLYFFSGFFGETNRVMNQHWSPDLALLHLVLQATHHSINSRVGTILSQTERVVQIPEGLQLALTEVSRHLADVFQSEKIDGTALLHILARMAELGYVTTGNGYYLYIKGQIKI